jgi:hypothetical protein
MSADPPSYEPYKVFDYSGNFDANDVGLDEWVEFTDNTMVSMDDAALSCPAIHARMERIQGSDCLATMVLHHDVEHRNVRLAAPTLTPDDTLRATMVLRESSPGRVRWNGAFARARARARTGRSRQFLTFPFPFFFDCLLEDVWSEMGTAPCMSKFGTDTSRQCRAQTSDLYLRNLHGTLHHWSNLSTSTLIFSLPFATMVIGIIILLRRRRVLKPFVRQPCGTQTPQRRGNLQHVRQVQILSAKPDFGYLSILLTLFGAFVKFACRYP